MMSTGTTVIADLRLRSGGDAERRNIQAVQMKRAAVRIDQIGQNNVMRVRQNE